MSLNANAILTVAETKRFLEIPEADVDYDPDIEDVVNTISQLFATNTRRDTIANSATIEYPEGHDDATIYLRNIPIYETTSSVLIWIDQDHAFGASTLLDRDDYVVDANTGKVTLLDDIFTSYPRSIKVTYYGGYTTVPSDLKWAAKEAAQWFWKRRKGGGVGISSVSSQAGGSVSYEDAALPKTVTDVLDRYRRW